MKSLESSYYSVKIAMKNNFLLKVRRVYFNINSYTQVFTGKFSEINYVSVNVALGNAYAILNF